MVAREFGLAVKIARQPLSIGGCCNDELAAWNYRHLARSGFSGIVMSASDEIRWRPAFITTGGLHHVPDTGPETGLIAITLFRRPG